DSYAGRAKQRLVDRHRGALMLEVRERLEYDARRNPLRRSHKYDLVRSFDREARERAGHSGSEVEQNDFVEAGEEGEQLPVAVRPELSGELGVARGAEQVQSARQMRHVRVELGRGLELVGVGEEIGE